jgi:hypothetical protein
LGLVYLKTYTTEKGSMVACCDEGLIGKTFREGRLRLSLETGFYGNSLTPLAEAIVVLETADILNLVGPEIVAAAVERGLVHPQAVIRIGGVPHAQVMKL